MTAATPDPPTWLPVETCGVCGTTTADKLGPAQGVMVLRCTQCRTVRFEWVRDATAIYQDGYHLGTSEFGWDYSTEAEQRYERAVSDARLAWLEQRRSKGRLADVGGGLGSFTAAAVARGWDATLYEPVGSAVAFAREHLGVPAVQGGFETLSSGDEQFDVVALLHVLEHFRQPVEVLRSLQPAIADHGVLLVEVPNFASMSRRGEGDNWMGWQAGEHIHLFEPATLRTVLTRAGYEVLELDSLVPAWDGLVPDAWAHFLGLERVLHAAVHLRRKLRRSVVHAGDGHPSGAHRTGSVTAQERPNSPVAELTGLRGTTVRSVLQGVTAVEERTRTGLNLRALARVR